jgi:hypothetical protein
MNCESLARVADANNADIEFIIVGLARARMFSA